MTSLSRILVLTVLFGFGACSDPEPGLWANTTTDDYEIYCTIEVCDEIETSVQPECSCPCSDDSDGCTGPNCPGGGDDDGGTCSGSECGGSGDGDGGGGGGEGNGGGECTGSGCDEGGDSGGAGCTLTQGYWKNHNEFRTQPNQKIDWPAPLDEGQLLCGKTLLDILKTSARGEAWIILAHQYIAASLNVASGASSTAIASALAESTAILTASCGGITSNRQVAIDLSYTLDSYNNGLIGPGHCD